MCFSAQASFIAATALSSFGIFLISKYRDSRLYPLTFAPLLFGIQQALEGIVWITINARNTSSLLSHIGRYGFTFIAGIVWPLVMSISLYFLETDATRKKMLGACVVSGAIAASMALVTLVFMGVQATAVDHHIVYSVAKPLFSATHMFYWYKIGLAFYCVATLGALFISSIPNVWILGVLGTAAFAVAHLFYYLAFGSVWCFFAAIISIAIWYVLKQENAR